MEKIQTYTPHFATLIMTLLLQDMMVLVKTTLLLKRSNNIQKAEQVITQKKSSTPEKNPEKNQHKNLSVNQPPKNDTSLDVNYMDCDCSAATMKLKERNRLVVQCCNKQRHKRNVHYVNEGGYASYDSSICAHALHLGLKPNQPFLVHFTGERYFAGYLSDSFIVWDITAIDCYQNSLQKRVAHTQIYGSLLQLQNAQPEFTLS
eukprot:TRINITY_DN2708_c0_g1_i3.p1 TRINITY_DN2708_c0_g1~~TRINITY_DN2708_c0_g1_i3.p1  ORF type:complete len:204 (+),score=19.06 TRINITY_DN2708_c0_g1_i3:927-1538(+)